MSRRPLPLVKKPKILAYGGLDPGVRMGRGFSKAELKAVGLSISDAMKLGLPVDKRRKSMHPWNIDKLKEFLEEMKKGNHKSGET